MVSAHAGDTASAHAGDTAVRKVSYVTTFKKQVIGPKEAKATEVYESKLVPDQGFTVDVKVHTPEVGALLSRPSMPAPDPISPLPCLLASKQRTIADTQRAVPSACCLCFLLARKRGTWSNVHVMQVPYGSCFHSHLQWDAVSAGQKQTRMRVSCEVGLHFLPASAKSGLTYTQRNITPRPLQQ